jgi:putative transposase
MIYNPEIHNRQSIRLKGYDYSNSGAYFITMCIQDRKKILSNISESIINLTLVGKMI